MPETDEEYAGPMKPEKAREQEAEFFGIATGYDYDIGGGETWTLPFPRYLAPDMRMRYLKHLKSMKEDVDQETYVNPITGKRQQRAKFPTEIKGALVDEDELLCRALMGDDVYEKFLAAGGVPGQVQARWQLMNRQMEERLLRDPKSD